MTKISDWQIMLLRCVPQAALVNFATVKRRLQEEGNNLWGDLNLAHERCRWVCPSLLQVIKMRQDFKGQVWCVSKTSERWVELYT